VAKALILEAEADYDGAFDAYDAATDLRRSIYAFERLLSDYDDTTLPATKLLWDYIHYRFVRLLVVGGERALVQMASSLLPSSCPFDGPNPCVGSTTTLKGIQEFATGFRLGAGDHLSEALELPQHWVGLDTYEHPLFWLAASSHRNGDPKGVAHALDYRAELGDDLTPDVAYVLDLYGGDVDIADGAVPSVCDTPGCLYFLAQYLYGLDRVEEGNAVLRASRAMCEITPTLVCAIVRFSNTKLDAGGVL
jgi:hypothetical protein